MQSMAATGFSSAACRSWAAVVARSRAPARHVAGVPCCPVASTSAAVFPLGARGRLLPTPLLLPESSSRAMSRRTVVVAAAAPAAEGGRQQEEEDGAGIARRVQLGAMIVVWYLLNIYFNIYNKLLLKALPFPYTITTFQFASGSFFIFLMWITNLHPKPRLSMATCAKILPMACIHMLGNVFTNMSLGKVPVSFTHTVKAMEPFFSVLLSVLLLGETPSLVVLLSLVPIVGGVALASLTEVSFNWIGFWSAMASNLLNQSRNVYSKKLLGDEEETLDDINLFSILTVMSFLLSLPLMLFVEGIKFTPSYLQSTGISLQELCVRAALTGFCFHSYQQVSYSILARVSPVTHSVANCLKRVVVIVSSVLFFRTPISPINAFGTSVALAGVFLYSRLKRSKPEAA